MKNRNLLKSFSLHLKKHLTNLGSTYKSFAFNKNRQIILVFLISFCCITQTWGSTLYLTSTFGGNQINIHKWGGSDATSWPGSVITASAVQYDNGTGGFYSHSLISTNYILNKNGSGQTGSLTISEDTWGQYNGTTVFTELMKTSTMSSAGIVQFASGGYSGGWGTKVNATYSSGTFSLTAPYTSGSGFDVYINGTKFLYVATSSIIGYGAGYSSSSVTVSFNPTTGALSMVAAGPNITSVTSSLPASSTTQTYNGATITVVGTNLGSVTTVKLGGSSGTTITGASIGSTSITFTVPDATSGGSVYVSDGTNTSTSSGSLANLGFITSSASDWNTGSAWLGGAVPAASSNVTVAHAITLNAAATNTTFNNVTIASSGITFGASGAITIGSLINSGYVIMTSGGTLNIAASGTFTNNGTFTYGIGTVNFAGAAIVNGSAATTFKNLTLNAGVLTLSTVPTIDGVFTINNGNVSAAPKYTSNSTLYYNVGYNRYLEWSATGIGTLGTTAGYPNNVIVNSGTLTVINGDAGTARAMAGNLVVNTGATFATGALNAIVTVGGNLTTNGTGTVKMSSTNSNLNVVGNISNAGTINLETATGRLKATDLSNTGTVTLSSVSGGDLELTGSLIDNATFNASTRAVFFTGTGTQDISGSGTFNIDYIVSNKASGSIRMLCDLLCEGPNAGHALTLTNTTDVLDLNGHTLTLGKSGIASDVTGSGFIKGGSYSSISVIGSGAFGSLKFDQTTPGATNVLKNLIIDRTASGSITLGNSLIVNEILSTSSTTALTIPVATVLTIGNICNATLLGTLTNSAGNAGLIVKSGGSLIQNSAVLATVERDINNADWVAGKDGWHLISSPVASQAIDPNFTTSPVTDYDFYAWWEATNEWVNYKNPTVAPTWNTANGSSPNFTVGKGYLAAYNIDADNSIPFATKTFAGTLNITDVPCSLTYTATPGRLGWNLLGNPFSSAITWDATSAWNMTNVAGVAQIWNESIQDYSQLTSTPPSVIPATNGFMVLVSTAASGNLTIPAAKRVHSSQAFYKSAENEISQIKLLASTADNLSAKESSIMVYPDANAGYDLMYDGEFLHGFGPLFYSQQGDLKLSLNALPELTLESVIPFGFVKNDATNFSIELKQSIDGLPVYLSDLKTNTDQNLSENPVYTFTSEAGDDPNRFLLHFLNTTGTVKPAAAQIKVYSALGKINISGMDGKAEILVRNMVGQVVLRGSTNSESLYSLNSGNLPVGVYVVSVVSGKQVVSGKVVIR